MSADAFAAEKAVIKHGEDLLSLTSSHIDLREEYTELLKNYRRLFKMSRLLMRTSDRSQRQLKEAEEALEKANQRMEKELNIGQEIQMAMLPRSFPAFHYINTFSICATLIPAREVGGDFYDFYMLDKNRICFCIGDVSGKGVPAALFMAVTQTLLKSAARVENSTAAIMAHVNEELSRDNDACMFVTAFAGILDLSSGELLYTNAGHEPPVIRHPDGSMLRLEQRHGPAAGAMGGIAYGEDRIKIIAGDLIFMFTDGITEAMNPEKKLFGRNTLLELAGTDCFNTPETAVGSVFDAVKKFETGTEQSDDITVLALKYTGTSTSSLLKMRFKNRLDEIPKINAAFNRFAEKLGIPKDTARKINLVFDELLNNIISYADNGTGSHETGIVVHAEKTGLTVTIAHEGPAFDPCTIPEPDINLMLDERVEGGLGIFLVKSMMDEFLYRRVGCTNMTTIRKNFNHDIIRQEEREKQS